MRRVKDQPSEPVRIVFIPGEKGGRVRYRIDCYDDVTLLILGEGFRSTYGFRFSAWMQ